MASIGKIARRTFLIGSTEYNGVAVSQVANAVGYARGGGSAPAPPSS